MHETAVTSTNYLHLPCLSFQSLSPVRSLLIGKGMNTERLSIASPYISPFVSPDKDSLFSASVSSFSSRSISLFAAFVVFWLFVAFYLSTVALLWKLLNSHLRALLIYIPTQNSLQLFFTFTHALSLFLTQ